MEPDVAASVAAPFWAPVAEIESEMLLAAATYVVVTNSFLAGGGDGWTTFATAAAQGRSTDTFINYAQGFIDWVEQDLGGGAISVPAPENFSTQSFVSAP